MFETQGGTRTRTQDLPKKGPFFIPSSDNWTTGPQMNVEVTGYIGLQEGKNYIELRRISPESVEYAQERPFWRRFWGSTRPGGTAVGSDSHLSQIPCLISSRM